MNQKQTLIVGISLLLGIELNTTVAEVAVSTANAASETCLADPLTNRLADRYFYVSCTLSTQRDGQSRITGFVNNDSTQSVNNVQLRISELDASGHVVSSTVAPLARSVPAHAYTPFAVQMPRHASSSYQVTVDSFEILQAP